jgi:cellulose synthase/poly-beta-1,6-N-acetylglucosamine synthase-like glycosyltransferase
VSVIVPVFNGANTLDACLEALAGQSTGETEYEVIVVDDGSTDGSAGVAARYGVQVIRQKNAGAAAARNRGAQLAQGAILLFTDSDCEPLPDWLEQILIPFADPRVAGVKGAYRTRQGSVVARFTQAEYEEKYERLARMDQIDFVDTHSAAYRRDVFLAQGGFDPDFLLDEDQELSYRLAEAGCRLVFAPLAVVYHQHPASVRRYARRKAELGRWKVRVLARHPSKAVRDSYTPWTQKAQIALLPVTGALALAVAVGWLPWVALIAPAAVGLASIIPLLIKAAQHGWEVAAAAPALALLRAVALSVGMAWGVVSLIGGGKGPEGRQP